jgi:hypothetical protein
MAEERRIDVRVAMPEALHAEFKIACTRARTTMNQKFLELAGEFVATGDGGSRAGTFLRALASGTRPSEEETLGAAKEIGMDAEDLSALCDLCLAR